MTISNILYTIGHSTHSTGKLIELLAGHNITAIVDVRSTPYSRFNPQFNRETLSTALKTEGIAYVFMGRELGARSDDPGCYVKGKVQYDLLARTAPFQVGLAKIAQVISSQRIALMCAEKDPLTCHRAILVCRHLEAQGIRVGHILEDGRLESHDDALTRLLRELGLAEPQLFRTREERIAVAYSLRGEQIAYSKEQPSTEEIIKGIKH